MLRGSRSHREQADADVRLFIRLTHVSQLSWALLNAHVPLVFELEIQPSADIESGLLKVSVVSRNDVYVLYRIQADGLRPHEPWRIEGLTDRDLEIDWSVVGRISRARTAQLRVDFDAEGRSYSLRSPLQILTPNEWHQALGDAALAVQEVSAFVSPGSPVFPGPRQLRQPVQNLEQGLASFIFEDHPLLDRMRVDALVEQSLRSVTGDPGATLHDYATGPPDSRRQLLQAVYITLMNEFPTFHTREHAGSHGMSSQKVRLLGDLLSRRSHLTSRVWRNPATCADLVLLVSSLMERVGLRSVVMITHHGWHAIAGCWLRDECQFRDGIVCRDGGEIRDLHARGYLLPVDITAYAQGRSFATALEDGEASLAGSDPSGFRYAVDVSRARQTESPIAPLPVQVSSPVVVRQVRLGRLLVALTAALVIGIGIRYGPGLWDILRRRDARYSVQAQGVAVSDSPQPQASTGISEHDQGESYTLEIAGQSVYRSAYDTCMAECPSCTEEKKAECVQRARDLEEVFLRLYWACKESEQYCEHCTEWAKQLTCDFERLLSVCESEKAQRSDTALDCPTDVLEEVKERMRHCVKRGPDCRYLQDED